MCHQESEGASAGSPLRLGDSWGHAELILNSTPPSLNRLGSRSNRHAYRRAKEQLQEDLGRLLMFARVPRELAEVTASAILRFPARRTRDEGNFRWMLEKALGDALQTGRYLPDDDPEHFTFGALTFDVERGPARTAVALAYRMP